MLQQQYIEEGFEKQEAFVFVQNQMLLHIIFLFLNLNLVQFRFWEILQQRQCCRNIISHHYPIKVQFILLYLDQFFSIPCLKQINNIDYHSYSQHKIVNKNNQYLYQTIVLLYYVHIIKIICISNKNSVISYIIKNFNKSTLNFVLRNYSVQQNLRSKIKPQQQ
ncbi:unnamed protein product [Paramecium primaurelia]|uniref:Uncharacterized protein n=1 Tax=Paramecium primaurelia TaxID=5886 RepID=A0A8S1KRW4_PARPR|nr:unnamed protein product [Paramecium primaurelia]